jgi:capsular exopolysaccharide synthesis family protein
MRERESEMDEVQVQTESGKRDKSPQPPDFLSHEVSQFYRGLVGRIEIGLPQHQSRVLMLSSSTEEEGTTEVLIGLGLTLAADMGRRTAIVDCNTRHPALFRRFGTDEIGLCEYLNGGIGLDQALVNTIVPNLQVLPLGRGAGSLAAFDKQQLVDFVTQIRTRFDYVLIDTAPIGTNPESTILCDKVDAVVVVIRYGRTRREVVRRTVETIGRADGKILGAVLNRRKFPIPEFIYGRL